MTIDIVSLARKKMAQRGVSERMVRDTVAHPDQKVAGYRGREVFHKIYRRHKQEMLLRVVGERVGGTLTVVTAYLTSDIDRYWEGTR